jgi:FMN-dependent dehydrogenase
MSAWRARDGGVDGIYCSNHGGRQANGGLPAIDCLPAVVEAADGLPVLFDSGIRSGADIVKALALGATAVGIGRPYAYGPALGGVDAPLLKLLGPFASSAPACFLAIQPAPRQSACRPTSSAYLVGSDQWR